MSSEEPMQTDETTKEAPTNGQGTNENFVVLDAAGESEESEKEDRVGKEVKEELTKHEEAEHEKKPESEAVTPSKPEAVNPRPRKKPKAPVVDVNSLRKRKWQLKVYPLHADDLQLNYMSILCKLASESLLYIPSEGRHGKAELYVATQKETATIIGKLLRMDFHNDLLSIEVVRKDTGGKEDGTESKKECKGFLLFDKFLSKKIYDAKGEKGTLIEKTVTITKLPKAATKDFIGALFPFATDIEITESDNPDERKALVKCKTPVTSLLVHKSFKRLEINDVHAKISVDDSVKAITLPPMYFVPPTEKKDTGPPDSIESLNQSSLRKRPLLTPLNRRVQQIKKRAILTRTKPIIRGPLLRNQRPNQGYPEQMVGGPPLHGPRPMPRQMGMGLGNRFGGDRMQGARGGGRMYPMGPGRRRMMEQQNDRRIRNRGDSRERSVTKEMMQLQNQLNQAIKNQIAMLNKAQEGGSMMSDDYPMPSTSHKAGLLGHRPRHFGSDTLIPPPAPSRGLDHHHPGEGRGAWIDRGPRVDRPGAARPDHNRGERLERVEHPGRPDNRRVDVNAHINQHGRHEPRTHERGERSSKEVTPRNRNQRQQPQAYEGNAVPSEVPRSKPERSPLNRTHKADRSTSQSRRPSDYPNSDNRSQRSERSYAGNSSHAQAGSSGRYSEYSQGEGNNAYYRRY